MTSQVNWRPAMRYTGWRLPPGVRSWLLDGASTSQLMQQAGGGVLPTVRLISQRWVVPSSTERFFLNLPPRRRALIREVELLCRSEPWMLARTVIPPCTLRGPGRRLRLLGDEPMGQFLFRIATLQRTPFEVARLYGPHPPLSASLYWPEEVWGRRSLFLLYDRPLLLSETFLPRFQQWLEERDRQQGSE